MGSVFAKSGAITQVSGGRYEIADNIDFVQVGLAHNIHEKFL